MDPAMRYDDMRFTALKDLLKERDVEGRSKLKTRKDMINALKLYDCRNASEISRVSLLAYQASEDERRRQRMHTASINSHAAHLILVVRQARQEWSEEAALHNTSTGFYRLPIELRNNIYTDVLPKPGTLRFWHDGGHKLVRQGCWRHRSHEFKHCEPPILRACKLSRTEAAALYYGNQAFNYHRLDVFSSELRIDRVVYWLSQLSQYALPVLSFVRNMQVEIELPFIHHCLEGGAGAVECEGQVMFTVTGFCMFGVVVPRKCDCTESHKREDMMESYRDLEKMVRDAFKPRVLRVLSSSPHVTCRR